MRNFAAVAALCGVFLLTGCEDEQPVGGSTGSATPVVDIEDSPNDCCVEPDDFQDRPEPAPTDLPEPDPTGTDPVVETAAEVETVSEEI